MSKSTGVKWRDSHHLEDGICELTEVIRFDPSTMNGHESVSEPEVQNANVSVIEERTNNSLLASLASGIALYESLQYNNSDIEERIKEINDLIFRLEDMATVLKIQLHSARETSQTNREVKPRKPIPFVIRYQLLFVLLFQGIILSLSALYDHLWKHGPMFYETMVNVISVILFIINALIVCIGTALLSKHLLKHDVESVFMAQTYFSTVIVFSSLYFIVFRFEPTSWEFSETDHIKSNGAFAQYIRMLYLSVSSATLCGAANIQPKSWYVTLMVCFQSLVNFVYFASILAQTIGNYNSYTVQIQRAQSLTSSSSFRHGVRRSTISPR
ncbi:uncharacterized protein LOC111618418 [Centruroides sculpturatus]|uniref:uncharacterized protein LOC111618418 n=1 Tax=Centruroides sculpturatus TaxID=218467 RepID=UPI000C6EC1F8|nr:uncharacterized protein LOC111618418 [Centruroides sculpturatus]